MSFQTLDKDQFYKLQSPYLKVGLSWDILSKETVDLDANCILFNEYAKIIDAVYYNQLKLEDGSVVHSGDNKTGEGEGEDESIFIDITKLDKNVTALVIAVTCYKSGDFSKVETAKIHLTDAQTGQPLVHISLGCQGKHTSLIMCTIYQFQGVWYIRNIQDACDGRDFKQIQFNIQKQLEFLIPKDIQREIKIDPNSEKVFNMKKNDIVGIPTESYTLGLGWDSRADLDSSIILYDYSATSSEVIYYGKKKSDNKSIVHNGDNRTGEGSGDDETIKIKLGKIDSKYSTVLLVICVFTDGKSFKDVRGAYCRLLDKKGKELLRYSLSESDLNCNQMVMAKIERYDGSKWRFKALGQKSSGKTAVNSVETLKKYHFLNEQEEEKKIRMVKEKQRNELQSKMGNILNDLEEAQNQIQNTPKVIKGEKSVFKLKCKGHRLEKKDLFGKSDPYFKILYENKLVATSEVIKKTLDPNWAEVTVQLKGGIDYLKFQTFKVSVWDWNKIMEHSIIGEFEVTIMDVMDNKTVPIINPGNKKSGYSDSGKFEFNCQAQQFEEDIDNEKFFSLQNKIKDLENKKKSLQKDIDTFNAQDQ